MVNLKQFLFSLLLPFGVVIVVPIILLIVFESKLYLFNTNIYFLFLGIIVLVLGLLLFGTCIVMFYRKGKGTLMPISKIHPNKLVIKGPYKYVRNPMIIGVIIILLGESLIFESLAILIFTLLFFIANIVYMPLVEEKGLLKRFGDDFKQYKENVPGWFPRFTSYNMKEKKKTD